MADSNLEFTLSDDDHHISVNEITGDVTHIDIHKLRMEQEAREAAEKAYVVNNVVDLDPSCATSVQVTGNNLPPPPATISNFGSNDSLISRVHVDGPGGYLPPIATLPMPAPPVYQGSLTTTAPEVEVVEDVCVHGRWTGRFDFFFSSLGYVISFANIWWFPYYCAKHGGIAFIIPYILMWVFLGVPIFYLETAIGQFVSRGPLNAWGCVPIFAGIGVAMVFSATILSVYFNVIVGYAFFYMISAFSDVLPWQSCQGEWSNKYCYYNLPDVTCDDVTRLVKSGDGRCVDKTLNNTAIGLWDSKLAMASGFVRQPAALQYFKYYILGVSDGVHDVGVLRWQIVLCMLLVWILVFICLIRNQRSHGKVVYFTALIPYGLLTALLIRACTLEGYLDGVTYFINPRWETLGTLESWVDAGHLVFFSLYLGYGGLIALSSYNNFNKMFVREVFFVCVLNSLTSLFAGFVIFAYIGVYANLMNQPVSNFLEHSYSLGFVLIPEILAKVPVAPLWVVFFFLLLIFVGIDTQLGMMQILITAFIDTVPHWFRRAGKTIMIMVLCIVFAVIGLVICARGGFYVLLLMESRIATWAMLVITFCECVAVGWVYGWHNFARDIEQMLGYVPYIFWRINWQFISPALMLFLLIAFWVRGPFLTWSSMGVYEYVFPEWANIVAWVLALAVVACIPVSALIVICLGNGTCGNRLQDTTKPSPVWGPALRKNRQNRYRDISDSSSVNRGWKSRNMAPNPVYASYGKRRGSKTSLGATLIHVPGNNYNYYDSQKSLPIFDRKW